MKRKFKGIISFLLTIIIVFSVFPTTVFGATTDFARIDYDVFYGSNQELSGTLYRGDSVGDWSVSMSSVKYITLLNMIAIDCTENELIEFSFVLNEPSFNSCSAFVTTLGGLMNNVWNGNLNPSVKIPAEYNKQSNSFSASYNSKLDDKTQFALVIYDIVPKNSSDHFSLNVNTFRVIQNTEQANNVNSILEWFKNLFDLLTAKFTALGDNISSMANSLKNSLTDLKNSMSNFFDGLGDRISGFFTKLGDDIKSRFTDLKNNLSAFFTDVGNWFSGLGDRISGFFSNLWDNITAKIDSINTKVNDWWSGVVNWFHSLFTPEDGYFDSYKAKWQKFVEQHFGFIYQSMVMVDDTITRLKDGFINTSAYQLIVIIPEIKLPNVKVGGKNAVLLSRTVFDLGEILDKIPTIITFYNTAVSALFYFALLMYGKKTFEVIIAEREL